MNEGPGRKADATSYARILLSSSASPSFSNLEGSEGGLSVMPKQHVKSY